MMEKDPINPVKRKAEFSPLPIASEKDNGQGTPPKIIEEQIKTWLRHANKIIGSINGLTVMTTDSKVFCVMSRDKEKIEAIVNISKTIDAKRQKEKEVKLAVLPSLVKPKTV